MNRYKRPAPRAQASKSHKQNEVAQHADVAQMAERHLAKVKVAGSNPVIRSTPNASKTIERERTARKKQTQASGRGAHCE